MTARSSSLPPQRNQTDSAEATFLPARSPPPLASGMSAFPPKRHLDRPLQGINPSTAHDPQRILQQAPSFGTWHPSGASVRSDFRPSWMRAALLACLCAGVTGIALFLGLFGVSLLFERAAVGAVFIGVAAVAGSAWLAAAYTAYMLNAC